MIWGCFPLDRRFFLKGMAAVGLSGLSQCAAAASIARADDISSGEMRGSYADMESGDFDVAVVGAGSAGCSAAVRAAQMGLQVALVDSSRSIGGSSIYAKGITALHTRFHDKYPDSDPESISFANTLSEFNEGDIEFERIRRVVTQSNTGLEWLESLGHEFDDLAESSSQWRTCVLYANEGGVFPGSLFMSRWDALIRDEYQSRISVYLGYKASSIKLGSDSAKELQAKSVVTGDTVRLGCKAIVLAGGGYIDSAELMEELGYRREEDFSSFGAGARDGSCMEMAIEKDAVADQSNDAMLCFGAAIQGVCYGSELHCAATLQGNLIVSSGGRRFMDESRNLDDAVFACNSIDAQDEAYSILSQSFLDRLAAEGCQSGCEPFIPANAKLDGAISGLSPSEHLIRLIDTGRAGVFKSRDLSGLAERAGIDSGALAETIDEYEGYCSGGVDEAFGKPADYLKSLGEGPYYALRLVPGYFSTLGGMQVDECCRAADAEGNVLRGLYIAGCDASGILGSDISSSSIEGLEQCWCVYSGKLAAEHIAYALFSTPCSDEFANPAASSDEGD